MNARELRIGNLLQKDGEIFEADFISIKMAHNYDPIPLTDEWMVGFGFKNQRENEYLISMDLDYHLSMSFYPGGVYPTLIKDAEYHNFPAQVIGLISIDYVHQLQNLYFSLTGEELTIKN